MTERISALRHRMIGYERPAAVCQVCATIAAAGYVEGQAVSFGWPRPGRSSFSKALKAVYADFGDGAPRRKPLPAAPAKIKDGGIDVIAWRPSPDGLPGTHYLLGQVASGHNWKQKSVVEDSRLFHWAWFDIPPATERQHAIFIPFCLEPEHGSIQAGDPRQALAEHIQFLTVTFGVVFYRHRLVAFSARALALHEEGRIALARKDELAALGTWVEGVRKGMREK